MKDLNVTQETIKILQENTGNNLFDLGHKKLLTRHAGKGKENKSKNEVLWPHQDKKRLHSERNNQQNWKTT